MFRLCWWKEGERIDFEKEMEKLEIRKYQ